MDIPSFKEDYISLIPALQLLQKLGYTYLPPDEVSRLRGGKTSNVLLDDILRKQLKEINAEKRISSTKFTYVSDANIENGIRALRDLPMQDGYIAACETAYNLITLGKAFEQSFDGEKKSISLQYIDWQNIDNNVFHVADQYSVVRSTSKEHYIPDLVLFVNGIPFCIIECKRPDKKESLAQSISQHLRSQQEDGIRSLYVYAQMIMSISSQDATYATNGTKEKFWAKWQEKFVDDEAKAAYHSALAELKNRPLTTEQKEKLFYSRFKPARSFFEEMESAEMLPTVQDQYLFSLCGRKRLLDMVFNFILFDNGEKKIARYQQYFAIKKSIQRITQMEDGKRRGGVIWHTQGSGKSLTMVMLAQAIAMEKTVRNPKIVLVTDRTDLDDQITKTFRKCGKFVENAGTGQRLVELLESKSDAVVTTIINKFSAAVRKIKTPLENHDIFVLVDEGHRSQYGTFNVEMQKTLPNACFIAMTGTPLFKKDKSTAEKFGGIIDTYTVDQAVEDNAVVPLLYEGRVARQEVNARPIDAYFGMVTEPLNEYQRADFKRKFSRTDQLSNAEQKIYAIAWDISKHFRDNWQGTGLKGQLVCNNKLNAVRYKEFLDIIGIVSTEVLISPLDEREGEETAYGHSSDKENQFWRRMMEEHGNAKTYEKNIINRFKNQQDPEIVIVVDKLLTGFDEPKNTVLYLTRNLQEHKLLQAIARVNRVYPDKEFGYIIDYYGVIKNLDDALSMYSTFSEFDVDDLKGTLTNISEEIGRLPQKHSELWDIFKTIRNRRDPEAYQVLLKDEALRVLFYDKLSKYAKCLKLAMSSVKFQEQAGNDLISRYKEDLAMFLKLRLSVIERYSDEVNFKQYEGQIQKLIDTHITTEKVETITELVNIFDKEKFQQELEKTTGQSAKADKIASRTAKHITEKMDEDPAFYKKFSEMLRETIADHEAQRISEAHYLRKVQEIMNNVLTYTDKDVPQELLDKDLAKAYYGIGIESFTEKKLADSAKRQIATAMALRLEDFTRNAIMDNGKPVIDWQLKTNITGKLQIDIGDYLIDEVRDRYNIDLSFDEMDEIATKCIQIAKARYK